jgi:hypothetical protein
MKSTVKGGVHGDQYVIVMDKKIDDLRRKIWKTIFKERKDLSDCDVAMALGIVQYELIHHSGE